MFEVEKPRQFHYVPRFYDPEKEKWEALKKKYAIEEETKKKDAEQQTSQEEECNEKDELAYFQQRVRDINREQLAHSSRLTWRDMFRKREMPTFNYQPRFSSDSQPKEIQGTGEHIAAFKKRNLKIKRRYDIADKDYMKPMPAGRIMLYTLLVCMLLYWILF